MFSSPHLLAHMIGPSSEWSIWKLFWMLGSTSLLVGQKLHLSPSLHSLPPVPKGSNQLGPRPAGLMHCSSEEILAWKKDAHRFPPYQYRKIFSLQNRRGEFRYPSVSERELIMGFPLGYTSRCFPISRRLAGPAFLMNDSACWEIRGMSLSSSGYWGSSVVSWDYASPSLLSEQWH